MLVGYLGSIFTNLTQFPLSIFSLKHQKASENLIGTNGLMNPDHFLSYYAKSSFMSTLYMNI